MTTATQTADRARPAFMNLPRLDYPLLLASNRDEFHARPAAPADWWPDSPALLGGRDLQAGGTWLGVTRHGRFGVVTNYREGSPRGGEVSRGLLLTDWLTGDEPAEDFAARLEQENPAPAPGSFSALHEIIFSSTINA